MTESAGDKSGLPARGYSWPPFQPGHTFSLTHGAYSAQAREPVARDIVESTLREPTVARFLADPSFAGALWSWANAEAELLLLRSWLDEHGWLDDDGAERPAARRLNLVEHRAMRLRDSLGLTPSARARIFRDASIGKRVGLSLVDLSASELDGEGGSS